MKTRHVKFVLAAILALLAIFQIASQRVTMDRISRKQEEQVIELKRMQEENSRLLEEVENLNSAEYIEQQARERLQMIKPDEIPVINVPGAGKAPEGAEKNEKPEEPGAASDTEP